MGSRRTQSIIDNHFLSVYYTHNEKWGNSATVKEGGGGFSII